MLNMTEKNTIANNMRLFTFHNLTVFNPVFENKKPPSAHTHELIEVYISYCKF